MFRARLEAVLAVLFAVAAVSAAIWPTWIEGLTKFEPDGGSGEAEWWVVVLLGAMALTSAVFARRHYRAFGARARSDAI